MILAGLGAALGATFRYFLTVTIKPNHLWPKTTFFINMTGAFCLGFLFALGVDKNVYTFLGIGILGGYTTFSTLNKELVTLRKTKIGLLYAVSSYLLGLLLVYIGFYLGKMM
ncbi:CrcB family protein [Lactobacillus mulieris]|uniref:CrcB family protein n=1 Tax=Lactobacillus mulieris TaxID=2508708 RepID=UPI00084E4852|nr:CrcB family protein [Lactobacillus mulieris]OEH66310.1 camphor resistance protein CrcB [Lactobacillus jensenii]